MGAGLVIHWVLDELEAGNPYGIKGKMVGASRIAHGERVHAEIVKWFHPGFEDGPYPGVLLHMNATNLAGAVIYVEIDRDLCLLGFSGYRTGVTPRNRWIALSVRVGRGRA